MMDNATFYKKQNIKQVIINAGHIVKYLPTYSPDLNPIEHKWAQAKSKKRESGCAGHRYFFLSPYGVIKVKSLSYIAKKLNYGYTNFMSYPIDFRRRMLSIKKHEGLSIRKTAKRFHIETITIVLWTKRIDLRPATARQRKIDKSARLLLNSKIKRL